jgi:hypothetical protein
MMMRKLKMAIDGLNVFVGTGEIGSVRDGKTAKGDTACSFTLGIPKEDGQLAWFRVNAYGILADYALSKLQQGQIATVRGELMNRRKAESDYALTEVRCLELRILD